MKKPANCLLLVFILIFAQSRAQNLQPATDNLLKTHMDSLVQQTLGELMKDSTRVGLSAGIYAKGNTYTYNYGTTEKGKSTLPTANTLYEIGSVTKTFTATLLAKAITEKKISASDDIRKYLPGDYPNLQYGEHPIKIIHLTTLTSGLPNWLPDDPTPFANASPDSIVAILASIHKNYTRENFYADLHKVKLDTIPGSNPQHSNVAAQLQGFILEKVYNATFPALLETNFTRPLHMKHTRIQASPAGDPLLAKGYDDKGRLMPYVDWNDVQEAGGINSTAADMLNYIQYQLNGKDAAVRLSHHVAYGDINKGEAMGFNWNINKTTQGVRKISHTGGTPGFSSYVVLYPDVQVGIVILINESDQGAQDALDATAGKLFEAMMKKK